MENKSQLTQNYYDEQLQKFTGNKSTIQIDECPSFKKIQCLLEKNNATKATAKKLGEFIADANDNLKVLVIGDNQTDKSKFINSLLNFELLPTKNVTGSFINSVIRYGKEESVKAYFFDGQIATFTRNQISLFAISDSFSSQLMREGLDYLEIILDNEFLKTVTLFDTPSYRKSVFIKDNFLNRSQLVLWLTTKQFRGLPSERALVKTIERKKNELLFLVEDDDESKTNIVTSNEFFVNYPRLNFSITNLLQAHKTSDIDLYEKSNVENLLNHLQGSKLSKEELDNIKKENFLVWVERFIVELKSTCERAPYCEAYQLLKDFKLLERELLSQKTEQLNKIRQLNKSYEDIRVKFSEIETGHQLVAYLKANDSFDDSKIFKFIESFQSFEKQRHSLKRNDEQSDEIESLENSIKLEYEAIYSYIYKIVQHKLIEIEKTIFETQSISEYKKMQLDRACRRLQNFNPIVEAKQEILTVLNAMNEDESTQRLIHLLEEIKLDYELYVNNYNDYIKNQPQEMTVKDKKTVYKEVLENLILY